MSTSTDRLYGDLIMADGGTEYVVQRVGAMFVLTASELKASMIPVALPPNPKPEITPIYISQWADEANGRINDCGPTCVAMHLRPRGDNTAINELRTADPTGLTNAIQLRDMLKAHGVDATVEQSDPALSLAQTAKPYSLLLVNYAPLAPYAQDVGFKNWHWLIYLGPDPVNGFNSLVLDPDYWNPRINEGDHKSYPTKALRSAWRAYPGTSQATSVYVSSGPIVPPTFTPHNVTVTANLNIRSGPGLKFDPPIGLLKLGATTLVVKEQDGWLRLDGTAERWINAAFTKPTPTPVDIPALTPPPVVVPPTQQFTRGYGRHYLGASDITGDNYPVAKAVDQPGILQALYARNPNAVYIHRHYYSFAEQDALLRLMQSDMPAALNKWFADNVGYLASLPFAHHEGLNEVDGPPHYLEFERQRTERLATMGVKACVLNISVARSDKAMWANAKAMVNAVNAHGGIVGEHSYGMGLLSNNAGGSYVDTNGNWQGALFPTITDADIDNCHTGLRILQSRKALTVQGQGQTRLVATELGLGDTAGPGRVGLLNVITKGWRDCIPLWQRMHWLDSTTAEKFYIAQLQWWANATGCLGTVFTHGTGSDKSWDVDNTEGVL